MTLAKPSVHLLDVNVLLALLDQRHTHHNVAEQWFNQRGLQWALCPLTEAGVLRFFTRPKTGGMSMEEVTAMMTGLKQESGYHYQAIQVDWQTLTKPFATRLHGHNQITDAYLLGLAMRQGLILTTFDKAILHLAGEHKSHVLVLAA